MDRKKTSTDRGTPSASSSTPPPARSPASPRDAAEAVPANAQGDFAADTPGSKTSPQKRWQETRGRLQEALAEWEKSEQRAVEMLKEAEDERAHLEDLLLKLKAKLQELS